MRRAGDGHVPDDLGRAASADPDASSDNALLLTQIAAREVVRSAEEYVSGAWLAHVREIAQSAKSEAEACLLTREGLRLALFDAQRSGDLARIVESQMALEGIEAMLAEDMQKHTELRRKMIAESHRYEEARRLRAVASSQDRDRSAALHRAGELPQS